jgi:Icc-related predicted phosphoesterase
MKHTFVCISDTHSKHKEIPQKQLKSADFIIHAGDISNRGFEYEIRDFLNWYSGLNQYTYKILIAGNHDFFFQDYKEPTRELLKEYPNIIYLENESIEIENIKFWGSPIQPTFFNWAFNVDRGEKIRQYWDMIPHNTDIVITHGPVYKQLDLVINEYSSNNGEHVGCEELGKRLQIIKPIIHISGHIHCGRGVSQTDNTAFINACILDEDYKVVNWPIYFELENKKIINIEY